MGDDRLATATLFNEKIMMLNSCYVNISTQAPTAERRHGGGNNCFCPSSYSAYSFVGISSLVHLQR